MKKFIKPVATGGLPVYASDLNLLQSEIFDAYEGLLKDVGRGVIIDGCKISGSAVSAGIVYLNGKFIRFNGHTGTLPIFLSEGDATIITRTFKDTSVKDAIVEPTVQASSTQPISSQYVKIAADERYDFLTMVREQTNRAVQLDSGTDIHSLRQSGTYAIHSAVNGVTLDNWAYYDVKVFDANPANLYLKVIGYTFFNINEVWTKTCAGGGWSGWTRLSTAGEVMNLQTATNIGIANLQTADLSLRNDLTNLIGGVQESVNNLSNTVNTKAANTEEDWILLTDYAVKSSYYRKDAHGFVHLRGMIDFDMTNGGNPAGLPALPPGYRPGAQIITLGTFYDWTKEAVVFNSITINTDGTIGRKTGDPILNGISFKAAN